MRAYVLSWFESARLGDEERAFRDGMRDALQHLGTEWCWFRVRREPTKVEPIRNAPVLEFVVDVVDGRVCVEEMWTYPLADGRRAVATIDYDELMGESSGQYRED